MYGNEPPRRLNIRELILLDLCPASQGPKASMPSAQLERWTAVVDAIGDWYRIEQGYEDIDDIEDRHMGRLDPVQRQITSALFTVYRRIMSKAPGEVVEFETQYSEVWDRPANTTMSAATQLSTTSVAGTQRVKIRTGRSGVSPEEAAVLVEGCDPGASVIEVDLAHGEVNDVIVGAAERNETIERLFSVPARAKDRIGTMPGLHCFRCGRSTRCGQYPALDTGRLGSESRGVLISKKWLAKLATCERQAAWATLYGIPKDDPEDDAGEVGRLGSSFHAGAASALVATDPEVAFAAYVSSASPSEQADLLQLWDNHKSLVESEPNPIEIKRVEYGIGATAHVSDVGNDPGAEGRSVGVVAVAMAGFADAVGRETDGTPAVLELRTGGGSSLPMEPELYAVGAHLLTKRSPVAVHTHRIGNPADLACERFLFGDAELERAKGVLLDAAIVVASWHPDNALTPSLSVGDWCRWCQFEARCSNFRPQPTGESVPPDSYLDV
jgi:hypothetical protein